MFQYRVLVLCCLFYINTIMMRYSINAVGFSLMADLKLSTGQLASIVAAYLYPYALSQVPLGLLLDRFGARKVVFACNLLVCAGILLFANAETYAGPLAGQFCVGLGVGSVFLGSIKLLASVFSPAKLVTIIGILFGMAGLGGVLATSPLHFFAEALGWRNAYLCFAILHGMLLVWFFAEAGRAPAMTGTALPFAKVRELLGNRLFWTLLIPAGLRYGVYGAMQGVWLSLFLVFHLGLPPVTATRLLLVFFFSGALSGPLTGYLTDSVFHSRKGMAMTGLIGMGVCVFTCAVWPVDAPLLIPLAGVMVLFGFFASINSIFYAQAREFVSPELTGLSVSLLNFFVNCVAAVLVQVLGLLVELAGDPHAGYRWAFGFCTVMLFVGALVYTRWHSPGGTR